MKRWQKYMKAAKKAGDKEEIAMIRGDVRDAKKALTLVKAKKFKQLESLLDRMDTAPREDVWMCLDKTAKKAWREY